MFKKIVIGILAGTVIGLFMTSFFLPAGTPIKEVFWTKITATSIVVGVFCSERGKFS